ncbi:MAG: molybdopterin biosynthesis protein [Chloroflexi bacterium]|nr:molybdopterin biosynthesis protein [Chloroflexota bacterium]
MSIYLQDIPLPQAQSRLREALNDSGLWGVLGSETIPLDENALGRVTAEPVWARRSSPHYHSAAMDGFAVQAISTNGALPSKPVLLTIGAEVHYVDTGDPLPEWANAVIPIENVESLNAQGEIVTDIRNPTFIRIRGAIPPWSHVRSLGEDIVATQLVLPSGHSLRPADLGAVAAAGIQEIHVARKPRVAILPTGSELVPLGSKPRRGEIPEFNSLVLAAQIRSMGGEPVRFPIIKDDLDAISRQVQNAANEFDLILLNAGSSAGAEDFSARVVERLGSLLVHGVAVRPGHPVILGLIRRETKEGKPDLPGCIPIIGVPGYPVSAALTVEIFVEPLLAVWLGRPPLERQTETAIIARKIVSPAGDDDYVRVVLGRVDGRLLAAPLSRGAGVLTSLVQADGLALIPRGIQGHEAGEEITVHLMRSRQEIDKTILAIGSHDMSLDLLAQFLARRGRRLVSANVGSQGGLIALRRREAHLAGSHLLDPLTGEYNLQAVREYLPELPVRVVALTGRAQGLLVLKGNPKKIYGLEDLIRPEVAYINRQRGAGTRVLLDFHLKKQGISSDDILGYTQEEYTHLGVAAAVASGRADCGLGIAAAAQALELEFVPLYQERYDLVVPKVDAEGDLLQPVFSILEDADFRNSVSKLTGYDTSVMGRIILED